MTHNKYEEIHDLRYHIISNNIMSKDLLNGFFLNTT